MEGHRKIGPPRIPVKIPAALLVVLLVFGVPHIPDPGPLGSWDVLVVLVPETDVTVPGLRGPTRLRFAMDAGDRDLVRREVAAFRDRVSRVTDGRLGIRLHVVTAPKPLRTLSGPGPYWIGPRDVRDLLPEGAPADRADTVMAFAKVGEDSGRAVPVRHLGGALGGDAGLSGACFAGIGFRPRWLDGDGTVALHEWLHGLDWALSEVCGFPDEAIPDPDDGRRGPTCCEDAPRSDGAFADHVLTRHLTEEMIRAADARRGPVRRDGWLRGWSVDGEPARGAWRTVTLPRDADFASVAVPDDARALVVHASRPVLVRAGADGARRVSGTARIPAASPRFVVRHAVGGAEVRLRVRAVR